MLVCRAMEQGEAAAVQAAGRKAFAFVEAAFLGKPKDAVVAVADGEIIGGVVLQHFRRGNSHIVYFDAAFIAPAWQGKGVGAQLYAAAAQHAWAQGATALTALVKDDNAPSWKLLSQNGFVRVSLREGAQQLGLAAMCRQFFCTPFCVANGMDFYLALPEAAAAPQPKRTESLPQLALYLAANSLLFLPAFLLGSKGLGFLCGCLTLLAAEAAVAFLGTRMTRQAWHFRCCNCGGAVVALVNLFAVYPLVGRWYPAQYQNTKQFQCALAVPALCEWALLLALGAAGTALSLQGAGDALVLPSFWRGIWQMTQILLLYRLLPFYPFEGFGSLRVWHRSKPMYGVLFAATLAVLYFM